MSERTRRLERNLVLLHVARSLRMALVAIPVIAIFWKEECGIGVDRIFVLQSIFSGVVIALEVPSGYLSDVLGRKRTLLVASVLNAAGFAIYGMADDFRSLVVAEVVLGAGMAFWSGTDAAMHYETLLELGRNRAALSTESRNLFLRQATEAAASVLGGYLAVAVSLRATVWATVVPYAIGAVLVAGLVEPARAVSTGGAGLSQAWTYATGALRSASTRRPILAWSFLGTGTLVGVWLHQLLWDRAGLPTHLFGWAWAALNLAVAASALAAGRVRARLGPYGALAALALWEAAVFVVLGLWISPWVVLAGCALNVARGAGHPIVVTEINDLVPSDRRATTLSVLSLSMRLLFAAVAIPVGLVAGAHGLGTAAIASGSVLGGGALVYLAASRESRRRSGDGLPDRIAC